MLKSSLFTKVFLLLTLCFMLQNALADDDESKAAEPKHLYADVDFQSKSMQIQAVKPKFYAKVIYPFLISDDNLVGVDKFNQDIKILLDNEVTKFKHQVMQTGVPANFKSNLSNNKLYIDHDTAVFTIKKQHIISVRFNINVDIAGMAHPYNSHKTLNYNIDQGNVITLSALFKPDSHYLDFLSSYTARALSKKLANKQMVVDGTTPQEKNFANWNLKPSGILFTFDVYQVAPYVAGPQTVLIPYNILLPLVAEDAIIALCAKTPKACAQHNLLTGGFIDEAFNIQHRTLDPIFG